jgi:hypothetical protein
MFFGDVGLLECFGHGFSLYFTTSFLLKCILMGDTCMIRDSCNTLWNTILLIAIVFLWKPLCKVIFEEVPLPFSIGNLRSFRQVSALPFRVKLVVFPHACIFYLYKERFP